MIAALPHVNAVLALVILILVLHARGAIRAGDRDRHRRTMLAAVGVGALFVVSYALLTSMAGHQRFPGDDWVRSLFLAMLGSHTLLAIALPFLVGAAILLARSDRLEAHRKVVRIAYPVWLYVCVTALLIYVMNNWVRPAGP